MIDLIKKCAQEVFNELGGGWSERIYHNALLSELRRRGVPYETEATTPVRYKNENIGFVRLDILVDQTIIVELKKEPISTKTPLKRSKPFSPKPQDMNQLNRYCSTLKKKGILVYFATECVFYTNLDTMA